MPKFRFVALRSKNRKTEFASGDSQNWFGWYTLSMAALGLFDWALYMAGGFQSSLYYIWEVVFGLTTIVYACVAAYKLYKVWPSNQYLIAASVAILAEIFLSTIVAISSGKIGLAFRIGSVGLLCTGLFFSLLHFRKEAR